MNNSKVAIVTGASSGIGKATAQLMKSKGYTVYCLARRTVPDFKCISVNITDKEAATAAVRAVYSAEGRIDVLVNCAGIGISGAIEDTPKDAAHKIFEVNFFGTLNVIQAVIPYMRMDKHGNIVNVSSAAAEFPIPFQAFYSATKAAISSLTDTLRIEVKPFGINVAAILPGDVKTEFTSKREKNITDNTYYGDRITKSVAKMEKDELNGLKPSVIAKSILKLAESKNPPAATAGSATYSFLIFLTKILPKRLTLLILEKMYG